MSKYIIDLRPDCKVVQQICAIDKGINIGSRSIGLLDELTDEYVKENFKDLLEGEYQRGFEDGKKEAESSEAIEQAKADAFNKGMLFKEEKIHDAYQRGLEEGKAQAERGCEGCEYAGKVVTGPPCISCCNSYKNQWTAKQTDDEIKIGDEVEVLNSGSKYLIAWFAGTSLCGFAHDGVTCRLQPSDVRKTGRHFDIKSILEDMRHD